MRLYRALSTALCVALASTVSYSQELAFLDLGLSKVVENNEADTVRRGDLSSGLQLPRSFFLGEIDEQTAGLTLADYRGEVNQPLSVAQVAGSAVAPIGLTPTTNASRFQGTFSRNTGGFGVGTDFYSPPEFKGGLIVYGEDVAMKIGGYVKADFIYDFDPIDSTDSFVTTNIPIARPTGPTLVFIHGRQG